MKYYSERTNTLYDTKEDLTKAEAEMVIAEAKANEANSKREIMKQEVDAAQAEYTKALSAYREKEKIYNDKRAEYYTTYVATNKKDYLSILDVLFSAADFYNCEL